MSYVPTSESMSERIDLVHLALSAASASRAPFVSLVSGGYVPPVGTVIPADGIAYRYTGTGTVISDLPGWEPLGFVTPNHFKSNTVPGTTDMLAACQAAVNYSASANRLGLFNGEIYALSGELVWKQGARFMGAGNWSGVSSLYETVGTTVFKYIGAGGANSCVLRVSTLAVGVEGSSADQMQNVGLTDITIDGNGLAEFGGYWNRSWSNTQFDFITSYNTLKHGLWAGNCWNGTPRDWTAFKSRGAGITLGIDTFGWSQCTVDQSVCTNFMGYYSGHNASTVAQNQFNDTTGKDKEYGLGIGNGRALVLENPQGQECGGAGLYMPPATLNGVTITGGYFENNGKSSGATRAWGIWYECGTSTLNRTFRGTHLGANAAIKITGSPNTGRAAQALHLVDFPLIDVIEADHGYYWLDNCDSVYTIVGSAPLSETYVPLTTADRQSSIADVTPGKLLVVGAFGLGDSALSLTSGNNLNALTATGFYFNPTAANCSGNNYPIASAGSLSNFYRSATNWTQEFTTYPAAGATPQKFFRSYGASGWSAWKKLTSDATPFGILSASYTLTSTTAQQKLFNWSTNGALTLETGVYMMDTKFYLSGMDATSGNGQFSLKGAGTCTIARPLLHVVGSDTTALTALATHSGVMSITGDSGTNMVSGAVNTAMVASIGGMFDVTAAGTIIPSIALQTAAAAIVGANSYFRCTRVADTGTLTQGPWT